MKVVYISDDGKQFNDMVECEDYEWRINHPYLKDIHIFDKDGYELKNIFSEDAYFNADRVVVKSDEAVKDLHALADYTGFCLYEKIDKVGVWKFDEFKEKFVIY